MPYSIDIKSLDSPQYHFINGWMDAIKHIKQEIVDLRQSTFERETMGKLDHLIEFCQKLEKSSCSYAPTVIIEKR